MATVESTESRRRLFVELLVVRPADDLNAEIESRYDEAQALTVTLSGEPYVEAAAAGETHTLTEVRGEHDDADPEPSTFTAVQAEGFDWNAGYEDVGEPKRAFWAGTATITKVARESDDADESSLELLGRIGTKTSVKGESEDIEPWASTVTQTFVARENSDLD